MMAMVIFWMRLRIWIRIGWPASYMTICETMNSEKQPLSTKQPSVDGIEIFWRSFGAREKCKTNACDVVLWFFQTNKFNRCISFLVFFIFSIIKCMQLTSEQVSRASRDESSCRRTRWCLAEKIHELRYYFETNLLRNILCNGPNRNWNENIWMKSNTFNAIDCFVKLVVINCMWIKSDDII